MEHQASSMECSIASCELCLDNLVRSVTRDQASEMRSFCELSNEGHVHDTQRALGLMQDRHSRIRQDIWALKRSLRSLQHNVRTSTRDLGRRIALRRPTTASPFLLGSWSGVLGNAQVQKASKGNPDYGDSINNFQVGVFTMKQTDFNLEAFCKKSEVIHQRHELAREYF